MLAARGSQLAYVGLILTPLVEHLDGLSVYPATAGLPALREALAGWFTRRYRLQSLDPGTQVLPVNGGFVMN